MIKRIILFISFLNFLYFLLKGGYEFYEYVIGINNENVIISVIWIVISLFFLKVFIEVRKSDRIY